MVAALSLDLRERILKAINDGDTQTEVAENFNVAQSTISQLIKHFLEHSTVLPLERSGRPPKIKPQQYDDVRAIVKSNPDKTLSEYSEIISKKLSIKSLGTTTIFRLFKKLNISFKKK